MKHVTLSGVEVNPTKIVCIGRNYVDHIKELGSETPAEPVVFIKPNSSIASEVHTDKNEVIHYEGEICFLIKSESIYGIGFGLDLTKRNLQTTLKAKGLPWERAKSFDKSAVFSEFVKCDDDIQHYKMELYVDGGLRQCANYELMIHKPQALLEEVKSFMTLEDGDIIMTGTPKGVGGINAGEKFTARIFCRENIIIEESWVAQ